MAKKNHSLDPEIIHKIGTGFMASAALFTAIDLGLFDVIGEEPTTAGEAAAKLNLDLKHIEKLLVALTALKLVRKKGQKFSCAPVTQRYLVSKSPSFFGNYYRLQSYVLYYPEFARLPQLIRDKKPMVAASWPDIMNNPERARTFILGQHSASLGGGRHMARIFDYSKHKRMIDLAGGSGAYSIAAVQKNPDLMSVIMDFPNVLAVTKEIVNDLGLSHRISTLPGDITKDHWPNGDLVLISLIFSAFTPETQEDILKRAYKSLSSGGSIVIHDFLYNNNKSGPLISVLYHLTGLDGTPFSGSGMSKLLTEMGFINAKSQVVIPGYTGMVTAQKP